MTKSPDAFRTISEVAEWLDVPAHVLRFWESRFTQVKPVKRAGGRRYYRPTDMELLGGIKRLLHDDGLTIRGVQKLLREEGVRHVAALSPAIGPEEDQIEMITKTNGACANGNEPSSADGAEPAPQSDPDNAAMAAASESAAPSNNGSGTFGVATDLYPPRPPVFAGLIGVDAKRFVRAGVDPAEILDRARALARAMDGHG